MVYCVNYNNKYSKHTDRYIIILKVYSKAHTRLSVAVTTVTFQYGWKFAFNPIYLKHELGKTGFSHCFLNLNISVSLDNQ